MFVDVGAAQTTDLISTRTNTHTHTQTRTLPEIKIWCYKAEHAAQPMTRQSVCCCGDWKHDLSHDCVARISEIPEEGCSHLFLLLPVKQWCSNYGSLTYRWYPPSYAQSMHLFIFCLLCNLLSSCGPEITGRCCAVQFRRVLKGNKCHAVTQHPLLLPLLLLFSKLSSTELITALKWK